MYNRLLCFDGPRACIRLGSMFHSMCWNDQTASLAALQYTSLIVWYDPLLLLNDQILVRKSLEKNDLR